MSKQQRSLQRWFFSIGLLVALGIGIALYAGRPYTNQEGFDYADAWREIGGALMAGGIVAGLVVWFEGRREHERVEREIEREQRRVEREEWLDAQAAERSMQRELDLRVWILSSAKYLEFDLLTSRSVDSGTAWTHMKRRPTSF